ncbi:hypothetical protein GCM10023187_28740 [Nibrella viscosa]|uniref:Por secretion system C-terminal sorting domain-containing protein n=1 Tax=Nibrella viscosa TaxID=1084524 RepID=A0ABP8KJP7_9BACT
MFKLFTFSAIGLIGMLNLLLAGSGVAQSITTGALSTTSVCAGGTLTVPFTTTGSFGGSNQFTVQLSNAAGSFASPVVVGTGTSSPLTATIPTTTGTGTSYLLRVVASTPSTIGTASPTTLAITTVPGAPQVTPVNLCLNSSTQPLTATASAGATLNWYGTNATGGTASGTAPTPPSSTTGTTTYYVSQSRNGCESARAALTVTVNALPAAPTPGASVTYCQGGQASSLTATPSAGGVLNWYGTNASGGTGSSIAPIPTTTTPGTTNYYVSQTVNGCESPRVAIAVTVVAAPAGPQVDALSYCLNTPVSSLATSVTATAGGVLKWYSALTGGTQYPSTPAPPTTAGTTVYYVSQTIDGCESPRVALFVTVKPVPAAPTVSAVTLCQNGPAQALSASPVAGATLLWYGTNSTGGTGSATAPVPPTSATGTTTYYVSQILNGCEGPRAGLSVTVNSVPAALATATASLTYCQSAPAGPLSATASASGTLNWYGPNQTGGTATSSPTIPSTTTPGTVTYYVSQTVGGCESPRASVGVTVRPTPSAPVVSAVSFCQNTPAPSLPASVTALSGATLLWYGTSATGGTGSATAPVPSGTTVGSTNYYVSQTLNGCEGPRALLPVQINVTPAAPGVNPVSYCNNAPAQPLTATGSNLRWYTSTGTLLGPTATPLTGTVGQETYQVTQTSAAGCESPKASLLVTINALPSAPGVSPLTYCQAVPDQPGQNVGPLSASGQNLRWYNTDGNPFPNAPTPPVDNAGVINYQVTQTSAAGCESPKATITVTIQTTPAPTVPNPVVTYCRDENATPLVANGTNMRWIDPYGRITQNAPTPSTLNATRPGGELFYVYQIGANGCASQRASIKLIVNSTPTLSLIGNPTVNLGRPATLQLRFTSVPPFSYTLSDGTSGTANDTIQTISVTPAQTTIYQVVMVRNTCGNGLPGNPATATVNVRIPTITTTALASTTQCVGTSITVPFTTTGEFNPGSVFRLQVADTTTKQYVDISTGSLSSPITATLPANLAGGRYFVRVMATNPTIPVLGSNSPTILTIQSLPTATLTGTQELYEGSIGKLNVAFTGTGPWTFSYTDNASTQTVTTNANPHVLEVKPLKTATYQLVSVTNNCGTGTVSGTAVITVLPLLSVEEDPFSAGILVFPIPATSELTVEFAVPLQREPAHLELTDLTGRPALKRTTYERRTTLDTHTLLPGLYMLKIQVGDRHTLRKVLKQ